MDRYIVIRDLAERRIAGGAQFIHKGEVEAESEEAAVREVASRRSRFGEALDRVYLAGPARGGAMHRYIASPPRKPQWEVKRA